MCGTADKNMDMIGIFLKSPNVSGPLGSVSPGLELQIMMASSFESNIHEDLEEEIMNLVDAQAAPDRLRDTLVEM